MGIFMVENRIELIYRKSFNKAVLSQRAVDLEIRLVLGRLFAIQMQ